MAIREPYKPAPDPQSRLIQIRGVKKRQDSELVEMRVPLALQEFFAKMLNHLGHRSDWFATCITCLYWSGKCTKFDCLPPPEVIADGCEYYEDNDEIPF